MVLRGPLATENQDKEAIHHFHGNGLLHSLSVLQMTPV
jgi:hypothetical protein